MSDPRPFNPSDDFRLAAGLGLISGAQQVTGYAKEDDLPAATELVVGTGLPRSSLPLPSDSGELVEVYNTDAGNAGAVLIVDVLDQDFHEVQCTVTLSAAVPEQLQLRDDAGELVQVTRVNGAVNIGVRGVGELASDVIIRTVSGPLTVATVLAETQEMQQAIITIPADTHATITSLLLTITKPTGTEISADFRLYAGRVGQVVRCVFKTGLQRTGTSAVNLDNTIASNTVTGPVDLFLTARATAVTDVGSRLSMLFIK